MSVRIVEVGPRDGLQNERLPVPTSAKADFIRNLRAAGLKEIEATSFVSPKAVPQLADASETLALAGVDPFTSALVPNERGLEGALAAGIQRIAVFTAASDAFTQKNINMSVAESLDKFQSVVEKFRAEVPHGHVRVYVSTIVECPFAGRMDFKLFPALFEQVQTKLKPDEIALGETLGVATPSDLRELLPFLENLPRQKVAWHFHDTRGTALANVAAMLDSGYSTFDSSAAGLGGCPFAPGAGGNLATEDLVYFLERSGIPTGVDLQKLSLASLAVLESLGRQPMARAQVATLASCSPQR